MLLLLSGGSQKQGLLLPGWLKALQPPDWLTALDFLQSAGLTALDYSQHYIHSGGHLLYGRLPTR